MARIGTYVDAFHGRIETPNLNRLYKALVVPEMPECLDCGCNPCECRYEAKCWHCGWQGYWDDCEVKVIKQTQMDPEERYPLCPECGDVVEEVEDA